MELETQLQPMHDISQKEDSTEHGQTLYQTQVVWDRLAPRSHYSTGHRQLLW